MSRERKTKVCFNLEEDKAIRNFVYTHGTSSWANMKKILPDRTIKQCQERWKNFLDPNLSKEKWTIEEDSLLLNLVGEYGKKWSRFVNHFHGRTDVLIKNRYNLLIRHQLKERELNHQRTSNDEDLTCIDDPNPTSDLIDWLFT
jgi:hypothetical protein